jgi:uncharacterized protein (TIGR00730 family)
MAGGRAGIDAPQTLSRICVFCGSNIGLDPAYAEAARNFGALLAAHKIALVFGGGRLGLMGEIARSCLAAGGETVGVIPEGLMEREPACEGLTELIVTRSMHERKQRMADLADAFVALPGGFGTFEELCEILTWAQLGLHAKPCGLLDVKGYYAGLLALFDHAVREGFLRPEYRALLITEDDPDRLLARLHAFRALPTEKWLSRETA